MDLSTVLYFILAWICLIPLAIINAGVREKIFRKYLNELRAHQLSTLTFIILILIYTKLFLVALTPNLTPTTALAYGVVWMSLTIVFEFGFGHYVMGNSWQKLLADYNIFKGRLWVLVLLSLLIAPLLTNSI